MAEVTASLVKALREKTGAGMMDCKKALTENGGDIEIAVDWLRKKGLAAAAKKAGRVAAEGLVGLHVSGSSGALVEVNAETDFVARNDAFQGFVTKVAGLVGACGSDVDALKAQAYPGTGRSVEDELTQMIATIGENMSLRRCASLGVTQGSLGSYMHNTQAPGLGKIGVLVAVETTGKTNVTAELAKQLAMHVAAANPQFLAREDVDAASLERERQIVIEQARASGQPENVIEKMVEGRLRKFFYQDVCLLEQPFVMDGKTPVAKVLENAAKEASAPVSVSGFVRFALGEGLEKKSEDFAAEVAKTAGG